jgi:tetratricopeptide (TPR) repeat protein
LALIAGVARFSIHQESPVANVIVQALMLATAVAGRPVPAPEGGSLQQRFDAATEAWKQGRCEEAVAAFEALEQMPSAMKVPIVRAATSVRKGICLVNLQRFADGEAAIRSGLPVVVAAGDGFADEVVKARIALGRAARLLLEYERAADEYRQALASAQGSDRLKALFGLAQVSLFDSGPEPIAYMEEATRILQDAAPMSNDLRAQLLTLRARLLLNRGEHEAAYALLKEALKLQGGLSLKVSLDDIATRSDLAIAAMLLKRFDDARNYLAYTGAGRMDQAPFSRAENMDAPLCGATSGLNPDDFAVVEFGIADDGTAYGVQPIYAAGGRDVALAFARAVSRWSWRPENVKSLKPFFRMAMRVEMRCTTVGDRPGVLGAMLDQFDRWATPYLDRIQAAQDQRQMAAQADALLDRTRKSENWNAMIALLKALASNPLISRERSLAYIDEAIKIAPLSQAPVEVVNWLRLQQIAAVDRGSPFPRPALRALLATISASDDHIAINTLRLLIASSGFRSPAPDDAAQLLDAVISDSTLPGNHPLKINALLQRATLAAEQKNFALAQQSFERTGLSNEQCAFIGATPSLRRIGLTSNDYPMMAQRMGFEGWVRLEFDVDAGGRTKQPRALIAYPPFVFSDAARGMAKDFIYESSYRPGGNTACSGAQQSISFALP